MFFIASPRRKRKKKSKKTKKKKSSKQIERAKKKAIQEELQRFREENREKKCAKDLNRGVAVFGDKFDLNDFYDPDDENFCYDDQKEDNTVR